MPVVDPYLTKIVNNYFLNNSAQLIIPYYYSAKKRSVIMKRSVYKDSLCISNSRSLFDLIPLGIRGGGAQHGKRWGSRSGVGGVHCEGPDYCVLNFVKIH